MRSWYLYVLPLGVALGQARIELLTVQYHRPAPPRWNFLCHCISSEPSADFIGTFLSLAEGDTLDGATLRRDELSLLSSAAIASAHYELDTLANGRVELRWVIIPRCLHTIVPTVAIGTAVSRFGITGQLGNFWWGSGERFSVSLCHRRELDIGWEANAELFFPVAELLELDAVARLHRLHTLQTVQLSSSDLPWGWGVRWHRESGSFWDFRQDSLPLYQRRMEQLQAWLRWGMQRRDWLFLTLSGTWQRAQTQPAYRHAAENSALVFVGVSSLAQRPERISSPFVVGDSSTIVTGAWGAVTLGLGIPITADGERFSYLAGELEQSAGSGCFLVMARIAAGNAFSRRIPRYTTLALALSGWLTIAPTPLALAWEGQHQNVWNWPAYRVERLDWFSGFPAPLAGRGADNRTICRIELRWRGRQLCPELGWTASLVYYLGALWNQGTLLARTRFHSALGTGLWLHLEGRHSPPWHIRAEVLYNWTLRRLLPMLQLELTTPLPLLHHYRLPQLLGTPLSPPP